VGGREVFWGGEVGFFGGGLGGGGGGGRCSLLQILHVQEDRNKETTSGMLDYC